MEAFVTAGSTMKSRNEKWDVDYVEQLPLSQDALSGVMETLAAGVEPSGIYGPTMAARDLARAAFTCKQMYRAHHAGMRRLGVVMFDAAHQLHQRSQRGHTTTAHVVPDASVMSIFDKSAQQGENSPFDGLLRGRLPSLADIKEMCRECEGCKVTGVKTSLAAGFLASLGLDHPSNAPLCTVWAVHLERDTHAYEKIFGDAFRRELTTFPSFSSTPFRDFYRISRRTLMDKHHVRSRADLDALKARLLSDAERAAAEAAEASKKLLTTSSCAVPGCLATPAKQCVNCMCDDVFRLLLKHQGVSHDIGWYEEPGARSS
ncbi:MAG: hypothetical protein ABEI52_13050 [Halobacteriaceae archaeon]